MTVLRYNQPAISIPNDSVDRVINNGNLLEIVKTDGTSILGYQINFQS